MWVDRTSGGARLPSSAALQLLFSRSTSSHVLSSAASASACGGATATAQFERSHKEGFSNGGGKAPRPDQGRLALVAPDPAPHPSHDGRSRVLAGAAQERAERAGGLMPGLRLPYAPGRSLTSSASSERAAQAVARQRSSKQVAVRIAWARLACRGSAGCHRNEGLRGTGIEGPCRLGTLLKSRLEGPPGTHRTAGVRCGSRGSAHCSGLTR